MQVTHPHAALSFLRQEFPLAQMEGIFRDDDATLCAYAFHVGRSMHFAPIYNGGVDLNRLRLFRDGAVYARNKRAAAMAKAKGRKSAPVSLARI